MLFAYSLAPIDFGWELVPTVQEVARKMTGPEGAALDPMDSNTVVFATDNVRKLTLNLHKAMNLAREIGWTGDFRPDATPRVLFMPGGNQFIYAFAWKHNSNGDTFVVSPVPIAWLERLVLKPAVVSESFDFDF